MPEFNFDEYVSAPNDAFFKQAFSDVTTASSFLQAHLSESLAAGVNWNSLALEPTEHIDGALDHLYSDLIYTVQTKSGSPLVLCILFEHQSTVDWTMPMRLLVYMVMRWQQRTDGKWPVMIPFVLHQGPDRWTVSTCFEDLFKLPEELKAELLPYVPKFRHGLLDLSRPEAIRDGLDPKVEVILRLMKAAREKGALAFFEWLAEASEEIQEVLQAPFVRMLLVYILNTHERLDVIEASRLLVRRNPNIQDSIMTFAQELRQEGTREGLGKGAWIGRILQLEELMGEPQTLQAELEEKTVAQLQARFQALQALYNARYKR